MNDVTIGIKSFFRPKKVEMCLRSLHESPWTFKEIIVADDGKISDEKWEIYEEYEKKLPLEVLDLEFDYGLAASRNRILEKASGDYFLLLDDDMTVPTNIDHLKRILQNSELGGVAGMLYEDGRFRAGAHDIFIKENFMGRTLVRDVRLNKRREIETELGDKTVYEYDFIPTCALFRIECLEEANWDPEYKIEMEHLDFFLNHQKNTEWSFALSEEVIFGHYPGGSIDFESNREDEEKQMNSKQHFKKKWEIDQIAWKDKHRYPDKGWKRDTKNLIKNALPHSTWAKIQDRRNQ